MVVRREKTAMEAVLPEIRPGSEWLLTVPGKGIHGCIVPEGAAPGQRFRICPSEGPAATDTDILFAEGEEPAPREDQTQEPQPLLDSDANRRVTCCSWPLRLVQRTTRGMLHVVISPQLLAYPIGPTLEELAEAWREGSRQRPHSAPPMPRSTPSSYALRWLDAYEPPPLALFADHFTDDDGNSPSGQSSASAADDGASKAPSLFTFTVPAGVLPGAQVQMAIPDGRHMLITIPPGSPPGTTIHVATPPSAGPDPAESQQQQRQQQPAWTREAFIGEFCDAYVMNTSLEGGNLEQNLRLFAATACDALARHAESLTCFASDEERSCALQLMDLLDAAAHTKTELPSSTTSFDIFLDCRLAQLADLPVGGACVWPGGWRHQSGGHAVLYIVERTDAEHFSFTVCNTGEGLEYHPQTVRHACTPADGTRLALTAGARCDATPQANGYPEEHAMCAMRLDGIAASKLADRAHLYVLFRLLAFPHEKHTSKMLYEVFLPTIAGTTLLAHTPEPWSQPHARAEPVQKSGTCYYRCIVAAFHYLMRRYLSEAHAHQLHLALRRAHLSTVHSELTARPSAPRPLYHSHRFLIHIAAAEIARSAVVESYAGRLDASELHLVSQEVQAVGALLAQTPELDPLIWPRFGHLAGYPFGYAARCIPEDAPPLVAGLAVCAATASIDTSGFGGSVSKVRKHAATDFLAVRATRLPPGEFAGGAGALDVLSAAIRVVRDVHSRPELNTRNHVQLVALVEHVMLEVLPIPAPAKVGGEKGEGRLVPACPWKASTVPIFDGLRSALMTLWQLYHGASASLVVSRDGHTASVLTHAAFMCALWQMATNVPEASAKEEARKHLASVAVQDLLSTLKLGFDSTTLRDEGFASITAHLPMVRPALAYARARLCEFVAHHTAQDANHALWAFTWRGGQKNFPIDAVSIVEEAWRKNDLLRILVEYVPLLEARLGNNLPSMVGLPNDLDFDAACTLVTRPSRDLLLLQLRDGIYRFRASISFAYPGSGGDTTRKGAQQSFKVAIKRRANDAKVAEFKLQIEDGRGAHRARYEPTRLQVLKEAYPTEEAVLHAADPLDFATAGQARSASSQPSERGLAGALTSEDAETMICALTEPYVRIPLALAFFRNRVDALLSPAVQELLECVVFSPGAHTSALIPPSTAPCWEMPIATTDGILVNELTHAPLAVLQPLCEMLIDAVKLRSGSHTSEFVGATLFLAHFAARVLGYVRDVLGGSLAHRAAASVSDQRDPAGVHAIAKCVTSVEAWLEQTAQHVDSSWLPMARAAGDRQRMCQLHACLAGVAWSRPPPKRVAMSGPNLFAFTVPAGVTPGAQVQMAIPDGRHMLITIPPGSPPGTTIHVAPPPAAGPLDATASSQRHQPALADDAFLGVVQLRRLFSSLVFLTNWHRPGVGVVSSKHEEEEKARQKKDGGGRGDDSDEGSKANKARQDGKVAPAAPDAGRLGVADTEVFALAQAHRPAVVTFIETGGVLEGGVQAGKEAGYHARCQMLTQALQTLTGADDVWAGFRPTRSPFRHLVECKNDREKLVCNVQDYEILMDTSSVQPLPDEVSRDFMWQQFWRGRGVTPHCSPVQPRCKNVLELQSIRDPISNTTLRLQRWNKPTKEEVWHLPGMPCHPPASSASLWYGGEFYGGAGYEYSIGMPSVPLDLAWVPPILDPVLRTVGDELLRATTFLIPRAQLPYDAPSCVVLARTRDRGELRGGTTELRVDRLLGCVDAFCVDTLGRRAFPRQTYSSDARYSLWCPTSWSDHEIKKALPPTLLHAEGELLETPPLRTTVLMERAARDGQRWQHVPASALEGQLPQALLERFDFWQAVGAAKRGEGARSGELAGERRIEDGGVCPTDPFFDYSVRVRFAPCRTSQAHTHTYQPSNAPGGVYGQGKTLVLRNEARAVSGVASSEPERRSISRRLTASSRNSAPKDSTARAYRRLVPLKYCAASAADAQLVLSLMPRLDHLSHILAWTRAHPTEAAATADSEVEVVELPRLKLRFRMRREDGGSFGLYTSMGQRVLDDQDDTSVPGELTRGLSRCLLVVDLAGAVELLVPSYPLVRRRVAQLPFTRHVKPLVNSPDWLASCEVRVFTYELHASENHVQFSSLASAIYWAVCKLYAREYEAAFAAIRSCATDLELSVVENQMLSYVDGADDDEHPDAYACRVQLYMGLIYSPVARGLISSGRVAECLLRYAAKSRLVSAACRVAFDSELKLATRLRDEAAEKGGKGKTGGAVPTALQNRIVYLEDALGRTATRNGQLVLHVDSQVDGGAQWSYAVVQSVSNAKRVDRVYANVFARKGFEVDPYEALDLAWCKCPRNSCMHLAPRPC